MARTKQAARKLLRARRSASDNEEVPVTQIKKINLIVKKPAEDEQPPAATRRSKRRLVVADDSDSEAQPTPFNSSSSSGSSSLGLSSVGSSSLNSSSLAASSINRPKRRNIVHDDSEQDEIVPILPEILASSNKRQLDQRGKTDVAYQNPKRRLVYAEPDKFSKNNLKKISEKYFCLDMDGDFNPISGENKKSIGENDVLNDKSEDTTHHSGNTIEDGADSSEVTVEDSAESSENTVKNDADSSEYTSDDASENNDDSSNDSDDSSNDSDDSANDSDDSANDGAESSDDNVDSAAEKSFDDSGVEHSENSEPEKDDFEEEESETQEKKPKSKNSGFVLYEVDSENDKDEISDNGDDEPEDGIDLSQSENDELEVFALDKVTMLSKINLKIQKHYRAINKLQRQAKNLEKKPLSIMSKFNCLLQ